MSWDGIWLQPRAVILKPQQCPWLPDSLWPALHSAWLRFCYIDLRNADSCFSSPGDPAGWVSLGHISSHTSGTRHQGVLQRSDKRSCSLRLPRWMDGLWESRWTGLYRPFGTCTFCSGLFALAPSKPHSLVRMTKSSREKMYYYYFKTSGILKTTTPKLSYSALMWWICTFNWGKTIKALGHKVEKNTPDGKSKLQKDHCSH